MESKELRRNRDVLRMVGLGIIAFGIWSIVKTIMYLVLEKEKLYSLIRDATATVDGFTDVDTEMVFQLIYAITVIFILILLLFEILIRIYVGRCAIKEAKGGKRGRVYLVLAGVMTLFSVFFLINSLFETEPDIDAILNTVSTLIVEITSFITLIELFIAVYRIRR